MTHETETPPEEELDPYEFDEPEPPEHIEPVTSTTEEKLAMEASNLQYLLNASEERLPVKQVAETLRGTILGVNGALDYTSLGCILTSHTQMLDATFSHFIDKAKTSEKQLESMELALQAQRQTMRAITSWQKLQSLRDKLS